MGAVRQARLEDARAIARIEVDTWRATYAGMVPDRVLLGMSEQRQTGSWIGFLRHRAEDVWVAQPDQAGGASADAVPGGSRRASAGILGFGNCGTQREGAFDFAGEIYTLYVSPDAQGYGLGRRLLFALFGRLVRCGHGSALIWVVRANPARFFYERLGGKLVMHRPIPVGGQPVEAVAYGWRDLPGLVERHARSGGGLAGDPPQR